MNQFDKENNQLWKWGIIYYNPQDPGLFVEKRNGLGRTLNFGNKYALIFLVLTFVVIGLIAR
jgi:uncharacterized membrane protein